jgi:hypothetical protein
LQGVDVRTERKVDVAMSAVAPWSGRGVFAALRRAVPVFLTALVAIAVLAMPVIVPELATARARRR